MSFEIRLCPMYTLTRFILIVLYKIKGIVNRLKFE